MTPASESTKLEGSSGFREYVGSFSKLASKSTLITGGDSGIGRAAAAAAAPCLRKVISQGHFAQVIFSLWDSYLITDTTYFRLQLFGEAVGI